MNPIQRLFEKLIPRSQLSSNPSIPIALLLLVSACTHTPVKYDNVSTAQWSARALLKDKKQKKTQILNVNILAVKPSWVRMDINSAVGTVMGTLIANEKKFSAINMQHKQFMTGPSNPGNISKAIQVPLPPQLFVQTLFEIEPPGTEWSCTKDKHDFLKECLNSVTSEKVAWINRKGAKRTLVYSEKTYDVEFEILEFQPNVQVLEEQTTLAPPKEFQIFRLKKL